MGRDRCLDIMGEDVASVDDDDILDPATNEQLPALEKSKVASAEIPIVQWGRIVLVAGEQPRRLDANLPIIQDF